MKPKRLESHVSFYQNERGDRWYSTIGEDKARSMSASTAIFCIYLSVVYMAYAFFTGKGPETPLVIILVDAVVLPPISLSVYYGIRRYYSYLED